MMEKHSKHCLLNALKQTLAITMVHNYFFNSFIYTGRLQFSPWLYSFHCQPANPYSLFINVFHRIFDSSIVILIMI